VVDTAAQADTPSTLLAPPVSPESGLAELRRRITYLMLFRLVLISLVLGATLVLARLSDVDLSASSSLALFAIIATTYLLTIVYALTIDRVSDPLRFAYVQLGLDLLMTALLVHITGGAQSAYSFFFPLSIIGAATVRFRTGAIAVGIASVVLFTAVALLGWWRLLPLPEGQRVLPYELSSLELARAMGLNVAGFVFFGFLAANLGDQIQRTTASLQVERFAAADLYALHEDIVRCLSSGLVTVDVDGHVLTMNQTAREILGVAASDSVDAPLSRVAPEMSAALLALGLRESVRRAEVHLAAENRPLTLGISVSPLVDHRDNVRGRIINFQDLTDLREMEQQVQRAERLATIGTISAGVAHELRNPLASISGSIELLRKTPQGGVENRALMDIVTREVGRLDALITELLDYANPRPGAPVQFDLVALTRETLRVCSQDPLFEGITIELGGDHLLHSVQLVADPSKLRQVLWNLLRNAGEAAKSGGCHIRVVVEADEEQAVLRVTDDGPGIPPAHIDRIFDPFFTTKSRGTGLGLAVLHGIVTDHGGDIEVKSDASSGTTITVRLPLGDVRSGKHPAIPAAAGKSPV
jgi:two-component system sensor histidine kinase PilS (NtrC family)